MQTIDYTNADRPNYKCPANLEMQPAWTIVSDVEQGTLHIRKQTKTYLPQFPAEHDKDYTDRLNTATFFNAYTRARNGLVGMVCKKSIVFSEDVPRYLRGDTKEKITGHIENIDLAGTHLDVFAKEVLSDAFDGHSFILVDMQKAPEKGKYGGKLTLEDTKNLRPYWVKYKASAATNFLPITINGEVEIGQITFEERVGVKAGRYGQKQVCQYRTFELVEREGSAPGAGDYIVKWEITRQSEEPGKEGEFVVVDKGTMPNFSRIPVAVVYGRTKGFLKSQPVLLDLALINIKYYQKRSDYDSALHKAGFPIPCFIGVPEDWEMIIVGSGFGLRLPPNAEAKYMEPEGKSLEVARTDLQDLREEMAALGLSVLASRPQAKQTATEAVIDFTQESSELETIARSCADAIERCMGFHAQHLGDKDGGSIEFGTHLKRLTLTPEQVLAYSKMVAEMQLTLDTLWAILKAGDALPVDFNPELEKQKLFGDAADEAAIVQNALLDPARQPNSPEEEQPPTTTKEKKPKKAATKKKSEKKPTTAPDEGVEE
jgi:hypothetical protein